MAIKLKKLKDQVIVITGASSGIGLATAQAAADAKAKLVLAARSGEALQEIATRLNADGAEVVAVTCDVADRAQVEALAQAAIDKFGRIDTWVNNAGIGIYGKLEQFNDADARRVFDVNFWGLVYGSLAALPHLKKQGGALINVGSEVSEASVPILGMYVATKHAVKGFTDCLRVEIETVEKAPVAITLIQPTAVDTPFPQHARNYQDKEATLPHPRIEPTQVAEAILKAAVKHTREKRVGLMAKINTTVAELLPGLADRITGMQADKMHTDEQPRHPEGILHKSSEEIGTAGNTHGTKA